MKMILLLGFLLAITSLVQCRINDDLDLWVDVIKSLGMKVLFSNVFSFFVIVSCVPIAIYISTTVRKTCT